MGFLQLDDWVLCRLYNKKNDWEKVRPAEEISMGETMDSFEPTEDTRSDSFRTPESDVDNDVCTEHDGLAGPPFAPAPPQVPCSVQATRAGIMPPKEDPDWFMDLNLDDLQNPFLAFGSASSLDLSYQDCFLPGLTSPRLKQSHGGQPLPPF